MRWFPRRFGVALGAVLLGAWLMGLIPISREGERGPLLVTSSLGANSAILFVLDQAGGTLAAYEAMPRGGAGGGEGGLTLLGARRIDADLLLTKYRDRSEFSYEELRDRYEAGRGSPGKEGSEKGGSEKGSSEKRGGSERDGSD